MVHRDPQLKEVFPKPPLTGFKRQRNLRDHLIRALVPEIQPKYPQRQLKGMKKCHKVWCSACPYIKEQNKVKIDHKTTWNKNKPVTCNSTNIIYLIECTKENCTKNKYIRETKRSLRTRFGEHRGYIRNKNLEMATGAHFNSPGHSMVNVKISVNEQVKKQCDMYRKERETVYIKKLNTYHKGLNKQQD